eukprot:CAMPEP_0171465568 /NCGR_PEP_ID=MMETSP0945-20130129/8611_1 /TAXON_ID=109269 /ORGANISM="Vaucheria litorea, Strain CCMP2940" /LENGTH=106 /DNA_ID=CAMNT_0011993235 /DNA_START=119 /DNA_END=436 /DNA_ORIENTATION=-
MTYKGEYRPSELLCPETHQFIPLQRCVELLDKNEFTRLNRDFGGNSLNKRNLDELSREMKLYVRRQGMVVTLDQLTVATQLRIRPLVGDILQYLSSELVGSILLQL